MNEYHKIQTVFFRDPENNFKSLLEGFWKKPEFEILKDIDWVCTEKIDGTNIRVLWDGEDVTFKGRSDRAQIPALLNAKLQSIFTNELMAEYFPDTNEVCLYGEGYGKKIQKGGNYLPDSTDFILFDIKIGPWYLSREVIEELAQNLNIKIVPIIGVWGLEEAIAYAKNGFTSTIAHNKDYLAEGLIMKPSVELRDRHGKRIVAKIKSKDFIKE